MSVDPPRVVALFVSSLGGGGAERAASVLSFELAATADVRVVALHDRATVGFGFAGTINTSSLGYTPRVPLIGKPLRLLRKVWFIRRQISRLPRGSDVVAFGDSPIFAVGLTMRWCLSRAARSDLRFIASVQVAPLRMYIRRYRRLYRMILGAALAAADAIVCISTGIRGDVSELYPEVGPRTVVIPNPVKIEGTAALRPRPSAHDRVIGFLGRLEEQKDPVTAVRAFESVARTANVTMRIAGCGSLRPALERLVSQAGLTTRVRFDGWVEDPASWLDECDVLLLTSRYEGFGNVLVEGMSRGCAIVATDCPHGPAEILRHGRDGILCAVGDKNSISGALLELASDDAALRRFSRSSLTRAADYDSRTVAARYLSLAT